MDEDHPIYKAIDKGGGQACDVKGVIRELLEAGYVIVPHDISNEACDKALGATKNWRDIQGNNKTVSREKMRRRWRQACIVYKQDLRAIIGSVT
jgi:hypothetical protein